MRAEVVADVLQHVKHKASYSVDADSVDSNPTFEYYPFRQGTWLDDGLRDVLEPFINLTVLPYVRKRYACKTAALADILVRRYIPGERRTHAVHFDGHALVTAVLGLCDPCEYEGGLYIQPEAHASSRKFFRIAPGDLVVHSFDLQHGVFVWKGIRYSMVFWVKDSPESVAQNSSPWYDALAEQGDADALFNVAQDHELGTCGRDLDLQRAMALYRRSAETGHHFAQYRLGKLLYTVHREDPVPDGRAQAAEWMRSAAEMGFALGQKDYALAFAGGQGVEEDPQQAARWMLSAAEQLDLDAACFMGDFCCGGFGVPEDACQGAQWYLRSAEAGGLQAQYELGMLYLRGRGVPLSGEKARHWLSRAAGQGHGKAQRRLTKLLQR